MNQCETNDNHEKQKEKKNKTKETKNKNNVVPSNIKVAPTRQVIHIKL